MNKLTDELWNAVCNKTEQGFTISNTSVTLGCARKTIESRMKEYGISSHKCSDIDDTELDDMVRDIPFSLTVVRRLSVVD